MRLYFALPCLVIFQAGCTARPVLIEERSYHAYRSPPQPEVRIEQAGTVTINAISYRRADSLPLLYDKPLRKKKGRDIELPVHVYEEPQPTEDLRRYLTYPEQIVRRKIEGKMLLAIKIDRHGKILRIQGRETDNSLLVHQAIDDIMRRVRFAPLKIDDRTEASWCDVEIEYVLPALK
jgi:outer membrane biosynthesis protein TonB